MSVFFGELDGPLTVVIATGLLRFKYNESELDFITRVIEEREFTLLSIGIRILLVLCDDVATILRSPSYPDLPYRVVSNRTTPLRGDWTSERSSRPDRDGWTIMISRNLVSILTVRQEALTDTQAVGGTVSGTFF